MSTIRLLVGNEVRRQFAQPFAWLLLAFVCVFFAWLFLIALDEFLRLAPKLGALPDAPGATDLIVIPLFRYVSELMLFIVPLLTMLTIAGEQRSHTLALLLASGINDLHIILGKYFASLFLATLVLVIAISMPLSLEIGTALDLGRIAAASVGLFLYTAALVAIGVACSAWTSNPTLAAAAAVLIGRQLATLDMGARNQGIDNALINWLSLSTHLEPFLAGLVSSINIVYFTLVISLALFIAARRLNTLRTRS